MPKHRLVPTLIIMTGLCVNVHAQTQPQKAAFQRAAASYETQEKAMVARVQKTAREKNWPLAIRGRNGGIATLTGIDAQGNPVYTAINNNIVSAATIGTSKLWPGGITGLNLNGSSPEMKDKLAVWDGGKVKTTHVELAGRVVQRDNPATFEDHSTHVSGTLIAAGVNPLAKGMAFGLQELVAYDYNFNISEMLVESGNNLLLSSHSYGTIAGWYYNEDASRWEWYGQPGANEDYKFGFYSNDARLWDSIAYSAQYHLIVKSAGNNRNENGPTVGQPYYRFNSSGSMASAGNRPTGISNNDGYDIIPTYGVAKNILTVGAVNPLPSGYSAASDVQIAPFSSWGPTDDGRIKPDVVADGVNVLSCIGTSNTAYATYSGTSMATPAVAGSLLLLQEYYTKLNGGPMRAASLKGLVIHTADEAGATPGPDYKYGWGLVNMEKAAAVITGNRNGYKISEDVLANGTPLTYSVIASGKGPLIITLCWADPEGKNSALILNNDSLRLVNDLDIRVSRGATTYMPWVLNPASPGSAATTGDNFRDNVEKIEIPDAIPGETYLIRLSHKGSLKGNIQPYSLIMSGVGGVAYCNTSAPSATGGGRIDSVSFAGIQNLNTAPCTGYVDFTNLAGTMEASSTVPLYVRVNSCDGTTVNKILKVYIDFNNDGDFDDAGELAATSGVLNGNTFFSTNVNIPPTVQAGTYTRMRMVLQETSNAGDVMPCGAYNRGQTQDYRLLFTNPSNDVGIVGFISPLASSCSNGSQYVGIRFRNYGNTAKSNITLTGTVTENGNTVLSFNSTYTPVLNAQQESSYTFQTPFAAIAGKNYVIKIKATAAGDQNPSNDEVTLNLAVSGTQAAPTAQAEVCNGNSVVFNASNAGSDAILWYDQPNATAPIASGANASTTQIKADRTYYVARNDVSNKIGPASKSVWSNNGGYNSNFSGHFLKFTTYVPLTIETVKLYVGNPGKLTITVADFGQYNSDGTYTYFPISSTSFDVAATDPTPVAGEQAFDAADNGAVYAINLSVPIPGDHIIILSMSNGASVFRSGPFTPSPYPYTIANVMSVTGNSAGGNTDPELYKSYYYFFYDMTLRLNGCASPRGTVVAGNSVTPVITLNSNVFSSSVANGNQWYLNGAAINGATGQTYTAVQNGEYQSIVVDVVGCNSASNKIQYGVTGIPTIDPTEIGLKVMPNPNNGQFMLDFTVNKKADLSISLVNAIGQKVFVSRTPGFIGHYAQQVEAGKLSPGVYLLQVQHDNKSYLKKLIVR